MVPKTLIFQNLGIFYQIGYINDFAEIYIYLVSNHIF